MSGFFGLERASLQDDAIALLTTVYDNAALAVTESILRDAEIPYLTKERGSGSTVRILLGYSMYGTDIYVREIDLAAAKELLDAPPAAGEEGEL